MFLFEILYLKAIFKDNFVCVASHLIAQIRFIIIKPIKQHFKKQSIMKKTFLILILAFSFVSVFATCDNAEPSSNTPENSGNTNGNNNNNNETMGSKIKIKIGTSTFSATLLDNTAAAAFKAMLPMTINMADLNSNEKHYDLSNTLPTNTSNPYTIQTGDLMLYGNRTLVLFYKTFSTSYSYTRLGRIDDTTGLTTALGNGNVSITFELE